MSFRNFRRTHLPAVILSTMVATLFAGVAGTASAASGGACPGIGSLGGFLAASNVAATFSTNTTTKVTTYTFISLTNENPVSGVPGLVKYCVYPSPATVMPPNPITVLADDWNSTTGSDSFSFVRPGGNKSNIPLDGKTTVMGTATWGTLPDTQTILLHISDPTVCNALYGGDAGTCWVYPKPGPICNLGPADLTGVAYSSIPRDAVNCGPPSHAFEATSTKEFGDEVQLASGGTLKSLTVLFNSYACEDFPAWYNSQCYTSNPTATFTHPITAKIYAVGANHTVGALLDTVQVTQTIPFRPSADITNCGSTGAWFNTISGQCEYSAKVLLTFNFTGGVSLAASTNVIWTVAFNTSDYGDTPLRPQTCNSTVAGCPYDSLNVGTKTYDGAPYVGTDVDTHAAFINSTWNGIYCDDGAGGTGSLRVSTNPPTPCLNTEAINNYSPTAWLGYTPLATIKLQ